MVQFFVFYKTQFGFNSNYVNQNVLFTNISTIIIQLWPSAVWSCTPVSISQGVVRVYQGHKLTGSPDGFINIINTCTIMTFLSTGHVNMIVTAMQNIQLNLRYSIVMQFDW